MPLSTRLRRLRLAAGMTQADLAKRLRMHASRVGHLENGTYGEPKTALILKIAAALGCDPSELDGRLAPRTTGAK